MSEIDLRYQENKQDINKTIFRKQLERILNIYSIENMSNTPDFILAEYLWDCLTAFDNALEKRNKWFNHEEKL